jgi:iron complex transport system substrate-binding protein
VRKFVNFIILFSLFTCNICAKEYRRIVSLAPSITSSLYELGTEQSLKGITSYCPKGTTKKEIIGTLLEPNIEKIISLNPDLIIFAKDGNNRSIVEKLKCLGFEVYAIKTGKNFNELCINYYNLAEKLNKEKEAKKIIDTARYLIEKIYTRLDKFNELKLFWEIGTNPLYTAGNKSFINDYNYYTKTLNIYKSINTYYLSVNIEDVIERDPDVIVLNNGYISNGEVKNWNKYGSTVSAVKNSRIFMIDANSMFAPTPLTFSKCVETLAKTVYGDIFNVK